MRTKEKSTEIYFVRHGQTDFPTDRIYCDDREDPALNRAGLMQAKSAAVYFQDKDVDAILCSPALRTRMTAQEVADVTGAPVAYNEQLRERRFGKWEGLYFDEIEKQYQEEYIKWKKDPVHYTPEGGETIAQVGDRVAKTVRELIRDHRGGKLVVVSHVGPIRLGVCLAFDIPTDMYRQIRIDYASINKIDYGETRNNLIFLNNVRYRS